jgi:hypothetical protein
MKDVEWKTLMDRHHPEGVFSLRLYVSSRPDRDMKRKLTP